MNISFFVHFVIVLYCVGLVFYIDDLGFIMPFNAFDVVL